MSTEGSPADLMRVHVEALYRLDSRGRLLTVNTSSGRAAPRFFLGRTSEGNQRWFRHDLEDDIVRSLDSLGEHEPINSGLGGKAVDPAPYEALLAQQAPMENVSAGPAYCFPDEIAVSDTTVLISENDRDLLRPFFDDWHEDVRECQPFAVLLRDGAAVSLCATVRTTASADEAGVDTHLDFRGQGLAGEVVATWAKAVRHLGRVPLYSTSWENTASQAVARKLGLVQFGADFHIR